MSQLKPLAAVVVGVLLIFVVPRWFLGGDSGSARVVPAVEASGAALSQDRAGVKRPARDPSLSNVTFIRLEGGTFLMGAQSADSAAPGYDPDAGKDEGPPRWVTLDAFEIQLSEVRASHYQKCVDNGECGPVPEDSPLKTIDAPPRLSLSVNLVTWDDASRYCASIGARLPTEAEWEYAARGTHGSRFPFGDSALCPVREFNQPASSSSSKTTTSKASEEEEEEGPIEPTSPCDHLALIATKNMEDKVVKELEKLLVGSFSDTSLNSICLRLQEESEEKILALLRAIHQEKSINPLKDFLPLKEKQELEEKGPQSVEVLNCALTAPPNPSDMVGDHPQRIEQLAGGMWEWVADYYSEAYVSDGKNVNPQGPESGTRRVQRGGGWMSSSPLEFRGAARASLVPNVRMPDVGFRCARSL